MNNTGSDFKAQVGAGVQSLGFDPGDEGTANDDAPTQRSITYDLLNNLGDATIKDVFAGNGKSIGDIVSGYASDATPGSSSLLRSQTVSNYNTDENDNGDEDDPVDQTDGTKTDGDSPEDTITLYDNNDNVTATIDPLGNVTATTYDDDGNDVADYDGQAISSSSGIATFKNLAPNYSTAYDVYVQTGTGVETSPSAYTVLQGSTSVGFASNDPLRPTLDGWAFVGTVDFNSSLTSSLTVQNTANPAGTQICLLQQSSATAYDGDGNKTATIDGDGQVEATSFDNAGREIADYQGQVIEGSDVTFENLTPNSYQNWYDVYSHGGSITSGTSGSDPNRPSFGPGLELRRQGKRNCNTGHFLAECHRRRRYHGDLSPATDGQHHVRRERGRHLHDRCAGERQSHGL